MAERNIRKTKIGVVVSDKMDKSVVVKVSTRVMHHKYGKILRKDTKFIAHDEKDEYKVGDTVEIAETRPLSKSKRWRVTQRIDKAL